MANSTDVGLSMCAGGFGLKIHKTSKYDQGTNAQPLNGKPKGQKGPFGSLTLEAASHEKETQPTRVTHHRSEAKPFRQIRRVHEDA